MKRHRIAILFLNITLISFFPTPYRAIESPGITTTSVSLTSVPTATVSPTDDMLVGIIIKESNPDEWKVLYDRESVWNVEVTPNNTIWILSGQHGVVFLDVDHWFTFSGYDYGFSDIPSDMKMAPDGTIWIAGENGISRYRNKKWTFVPYPDGHQNRMARLAIDKFGKIYVTTWWCNCGNDIWYFDGTTWGKIKISPEFLENTSQVLVMPSGSIWAAFSQSIGEFDGKKWKSFPGEDIWPETGFYTRSRIASNKKGEIYGINEGQKWFVKIKKSGVVSKIAHDNRILRLDGFMLRLYIDSKDTIWVNSCFNNESNSCLSFFRDGQWYAIKNLPFTSVTEIKELKDGSYLVASVEGLFEYTPIKK
jgi:hypothetical protein